MTQPEFDERDIEIARICAVPLDIGHPSKSIGQVVLESGFPSVRPRLTVARLAEYVRAHRTIIDDWLGYSQDKRTSGGWYFLEGSPWVVGQVDSAGPKPQTFADAALACATFMLAELDWISNERPSNVCPVCGYPHLQEPHRSTIGGGSYEICPSCGFQFGVSDDDRGYTYAGWREEWIEHGCAWASVNPQPRDWNPQVNLARIGYKS